MNVKEAQSNFEAADQRTKDLDKELAEQLEVLGDTLTEKQLQEYINAFKKDHQKEYVAREEAATNLANELEANREALQESVKNNREDAAVLKKALDTLADTAHGAEAVEFLQSLSPATREALGGEEFSLEIAGKAVPSEMARLLAESNTPQEAYEKLAKWADGVKIGLFETAAAREDMQAGIDALRQGMVSDTLDPLAEYTEGWQTSSKLKKGFGAAGVALGFAVAFKNGRDQDYLSMVSDVLGESPVALEYFSGALNSLSEAGKLGQFSGAGANVAKFAGRLAGPAAFLASAISGFDHFSKHENPGNVVAGFGDIVAGVGGVALLAGSTGPGGVLAGLGAAMVVIGEGIANNWEKEHLVHEREKYLAQVHSLDGKLGQDLATGELQPLSEQLGMSAEQIQKVAQTPYFRIDSKYKLNNPEAIDSLAMVLRDKGLAGDGAFNFFMKLVNREGQEVLEMLTRYSGTLDQFAKESPGAAAILRDAGLSL
jgi:hypothetical protein